MVQIYLKINFNIMSDPVEKTPAQKKTKVRGSVLRLLDADFKILEKYPWVAANIFLVETQGCFSFVY